MTLAAHRHCRPAHLVVATMAIDAYLRRPRRRTDRLFLYRGPYVADDAQDWLTDRK
jgi:hypothetical protein